MDADYYRDLKIWQEMDDAETYSKTVAGTGWHPNYEGKLADVPGAGRPPVRMLAYDHKRDMVLIRQERWVSADLLTPQEQA